MLSEKTVETVFESQALLRLDASKVEYLEKFSSPGALCHFLHPYDSLIQGIQESQEYIEVVYCIEYQIVLAFHRFESVLRWAILD